MADAEKGASAIYMLCLLSAVNFLNALDKLILSVLVEPIKAEFALSDSELGILTGFALAVSTAAAMVPVGILADRTNRRNLVASCLIAWSSVTALGGFVHTYLQLLATRIVVGIGEAGGGPPSLSMLSDIFPKSKRATAVSVFYMSAPIGGMMALAGGGWIAAHYGWRTTLVAAGLAGILIALLLVCTGSEPSRGELDTDTTQTDLKPNWSNALRCILRSRSLLHLLAGIALVAFATSGMATWAPAYFMRSHEMSLERVGMVLALVQATGLIGPILAAAFADRLAAKDQRWWCWIVAIGVTAGGFALAVSTLVAGVDLALLFYCTYMVAVSIWYGPSYGTVQSLVPANMRATVTATFYTVGNVVGFGMGTQSVGVVSDLLVPYAGPDSLRYALAMLALVCLWAGLHFMLAARSVRQDLKQGAI
jgi:MFS family permease